MKKTAFRSIVVGVVGGVFWGCALPVAAEETAVENMQIAYDATAALEQRLADLKAEYQTGQSLLADWEAKKAALESTLLRISGAIQVLEDELASGMDEALRAKVEARLADLKQEYATGQQMLADYEQKISDLRLNLLRIAGAIQVIEEELNNSAS